MLIAQITDCHIQPDGTDPAGGFDTAADLARIIDFLNAYAPQPDFVIATGDLTERGTPEGYAHFVSLVKPLKAPLLAIPGNHDKRDPFRAALGPISQIGTDTPFLHFVQDHDDPEFGPFRFIAVDSIEAKETGGHQCAERLAWLDERLSEAQDIPTVIAMHHPPFHVGIPVFDNFGFQGLEAFRTLIERHPQIDLIMAGHVHRAFTTRLGSAFVYVSPSTSYAYPLEMRAGAPFGRRDEAPAVSFHLRTGPRSWVSHVQPVARP